MSLEIGANQQVLHDTSKGIANEIKRGTVRVRDVPVYKTTSSKELQPKIPSPNIFNTLTDVLEEKNSLPTTAECSVHLEFLAVLHALRRRVIDSKELDEVFDIKPINRTVKRRRRTVKLRDTTFWTRREVKWDKFIDLAVVRFLAWWEKAPEIFFPRNGQPVQWKDKTLPPLGENTTSLSDKTILTH